MKYFKFSLLIAIILIGYIFARFAFTYYLTGSANLLEPIYYVVIVGDIVFVLIMLRIMRKFLIKLSQNRYLLQIGYIAGFISLLLVLASVLIDWLLPDQFYYTLPYLLSAFKGVVILKLIGMFALWFLILVFLAFPRQEIRFHEYFKFQNIRLILKPISRYLIVYLVLTIMYYFAMLLLRDIVTDIDLNVVVYFGMTVLATIIVDKWQKSKILSKEYFMTLNVWVIVVSVVSFGLYLILGITYNLVVLGSNEMPFQGYITGKTFIAVMYGLEVMIVNFFVLRLYYLLVELASQKV